MNDSEPAAAALMPESSMGPKIRKGSLSEPTYIAVAKYIPSFTHILSRKWNHFL